MITKGPSREKIIILISSDNINKFMKNSSLHVANINQSLRNLKSKVLVDFIYLDLIEVMIVTNKVVVYSNLYIIENYVKNINNINSLNIEVL